MNRSITLPLRLALPHFEGVGKHSIHALETLQLWQQRHRSRQQLLQLSQHVLKDVGITRAEAIKEANKWFWQP